MKIILKHILRNIKEKKGRILLIIISLMIASCVFILNLTIPNQIFEANKRNMKENIGKSDILVSSFDEFNINDLKRNNEEIKYVGVNELSLIHKNKTFTIYATDTKKCNELDLLNQDITLGDNEIIISKQTAEKYEYKENDIIKVDIDDEQYELKIKKILDNKGLLYFKNLSGIVSENTLNKITGIEQNKYTSYYIDVANDENARNVKDYLKQNNKDFIVLQLVDEDAIRDKNSYTQLILIIVFIMATIMIFVVVNTLNKMIVLERMPVIGTFRSIGASKKRMNALLVLENVMYGFLGGVIGAAVSLAINNVAVKILLDGQNVAGGIEFSNLALGVVFAIIMELLMSIGAVIKAARYSIKDVIFEDKNSRFKLSKISTAFSLLFICVAICIYKFADDSDVLLDLASVVLFGVGIARVIPFVMMVLSKILCSFAKKMNNGSFIIAAKNLGNNKLLISSTRLVVVSISIMLVILNLSWAFNKSFDANKAQTTDIDLFIRETSKEYTEYEKLTKIVDIDRVKMDFMYSDDSVTFNDKKFSVNPIIVGRSDVGSDFKELNYNIKDLKENEILMDEYLLKDNNLKVGDTIDFSIREINLRLNLKIVGSVDSYNYSAQRNVIAMNESTFVNNISKVPFQVFVQTKDGCDFKFVISEIEKELKEPDVLIQTLDEFIEGQRKQINTIMSLFYIIIGLALTLAFVGIINNQIISFMERTRELAVLNSVCMSKLQIIKMLILENVVSNIVACGLGLLVSIMSVKLINAILNGIKMYTDMTFNYQAGFMIVGAILVVLLATVVLPIRKMKKINIVESIKYE